MRPLSLFRHEPEKKKAAVLLRSRKRFALRQLEDAGEKERESPFRKSSRKRTECFVSRPVLEKTREIALETGDSIPTKNNLPIHRLFRVFPDSAPTSAVQTESLLQERPLTRPLGCGFRTGIDEVRRLKTRLFSGRFVQFTSRTAILFSATRRNREDPAGV
jgi:hypothetical protein